MPLDLLHFVRVEWSRLAEDRLRDGDLPDVVERTADIDGIETGIVLFEPRGEARGQLGHARGVGCERGIEGGLNGRSGSHHRPAVIPGRGGLSFTSRCR